MEDQYTERYSVKTIIKLFMEKIFIGKRIRDIVYNKNNNMFILS